ncbi:MAG TPA: aconitase X, partial [Gammaproteobacteria bacterium]|nr:aconitase X [Gammaproteobacteria bacterium]
MKLNDEERAMLDGRRGEACRMALELLVRYGEALGVERFVDVVNVAGVPASANKFIKEYFRPYYQPDRDEYDVIFSLYDLDGAAV